jgi:hypothetical protein
MPSARDVAFRENANSGKPARPGANRGGPFPGSNSEKCRSALFSTPQLRDGARVCLLDDHTDGWLSTI